MDSHNQASSERSPSYSREQLSASGLARSRRAAIRRRARRIRRVVASFAAALFSTVFLVVYVQLASGHDPALSKKRAAATAVVSTAPTAANTSTSKSTESSTTAPSTSTESTKTASAVTTSQS